MTCPHCTYSKTSVIDSRPKEGTTWRRRECDACHARWSTMEYIEQPGLRETRDLLLKLKADMHALIDGLSI